MQFDDSKSIKEIVTETVRLIDNRSQKQNADFGILTGFETLDRAIFGLHKGDLITINSYISEWTVFGWKSFLFQLLFNISVKNKVPCGLFTYDMSFNRIGMELIGLATRIPRSRLHSGLVSQHDYAALAEEGDSVYSAPLVVKQFYMLTFEELCNEIRRKTAANNLKVIFVDSLNSIPLDAEIGSKKDRHLAILKKLKALAMELDVSIITAFYIEDSSKEKTLERKTEYFKLYSDVLLFLQRHEDPSSNIIYDCDLTVLCPDLVNYMEYTLFFNDLTSEFSERNEW